MVNIKVEISNLCERKIYVFRENIFKNTLNGGILIMIKRVLLVSTYKYPDGDAGSIRLHSFAQIYKELGYEVTVIGMGKSTSYQVKEKEGIAYVSFRSIKSKFFYRLFGYLKFKLRTKFFIKKYGTYDYIHIFSGIPVNALFFLKRYAAKHDIQLVYDGVEWYSPEQFNMGILSLSYIINNKYNTKWIDKRFFVTAISSFLENHFKSREINAIRVPVIMDISSISDKKEIDCNKTFFLYAGSPGKKDFLFEIIKGFAMLPREIISNVYLNILGINKEQLLACGVQEEDVAYLGETLNCLGRIPRNEVLEWLAKANFTVLLRSDDQRYAKAGFPTKVVESLASGTPVITNLTSDLSLYLKNGYNSIVVDCCSAEAFSKSLVQAIEMSNEQKNEMCKNARRTAEDNFDYRLFSGDIARMIDIKGTL